MTSGQAGPPTKALWRPSKEGLGKLAMSSRNTDKVDEHTARPLALRIGRAVQRQRVRGLFFFFIHTLAEHDLV